MLRQRDTEKRAETETELEREENGTVPGSRGWAAQPAHLTHLLDSDQSVRGRWQRRTSDQSYFILQVSQCQSNFLWPNTRENTNNIYIPNFVL